MSFQNEDEEEDLTPNLSSEEFNELTNNKSYNGFTMNSKKEHEINFIIDKNEKDKYKMPSYFTSRNLKESKDKDLYEFHLSYGHNDNNKNMPEIIENFNNNNNRNIIMNNTNEIEKNINDNNNNNYISKKINIEINNNKSLEENKNSNLNNPKNDLKYNYQSFLAERLNLIHQNLDDKKEKEKNNIDIKEKNKIQEVEYYKYDNFSKKDIMNYYFNIDNINNNNIEIKNFNDSIKMDKAYKAEDKIIKENIQKNKFNKMKMTFKIKVN